MTNEEKWKAIIENNKDADGLFFYGVKTTKIFCNPSCRSKNPLKKNVAFFHNKEAALNEGYRPCKRCRPDIFQYSPVEELTCRAKNIIEKYYADNEEIKKQLMKLGVNKSYLNKLFEQENGRTITQYLRFVRIQRAKSILLKKISITECGFMCGFESISAFYSNFKKETGYTPKEFYNNNI